MANTRPTITLKVDFISYEFGGKLKLTNQIEVFCFQFITNEIHLEGWHRGLQRRIMDAGGKSIDFVKVLQEDCADTISKYYRYLVIGITRFHL